jgi:hypothetical protein
MSRVDKEALFKSRLNEEEVEVPGVGVVRVRGLSRVEVISVRKATDSEHIDGPRTLVIERKMLAAALVDPQLTEAEVKRWQEASAAGEMEPVIAAVQRLSGMEDGAAKAAYKSV